MRNFMKEKLLWYSSKASSISSRNQSTKKKHTKTNHIIKPIKEKAECLPKTSRNPLILQSVIHKTSNSKTSVQLSSPRMSPITLCEKKMRRNLKSYNFTPDKMNIKIINDIIYDEKKHIVSVFKNYWLWDESSDFLKRFYFRTESISRIPKISGYYEKYTWYSPVYFCLMDLMKIMTKNIKRKKKYLEMIEENEDNNNNDNQEELEQNFKYLINPRDINECNCEEKAHELMLVMKNVNDEDDVDVDVDVSMRRRRLNITGNWSEISKSFLKKELDDCVDESVFGRRIESSKVVGGNSYNINAEECRRKSKSKNKNINKNVHLVGKGKQPERKGIEIKKLDFNKWNKGIELENNATNNPKKGNGGNENYLCTMNNKSNSNVNTVGNMTTGENQKKNSNHYNNNNNNLTERPIISAATTTKSSTSKQHINYTSAISKKQKPKTKIGATDNKKNLFNNLVKMNVIKKPIQPKAIEQMIQGLKLPNKKPTTPSTKQSANITKSKLHSIQPNHPAVLSKKQSNLVIQAYTDNQRNTLREKLKETSSKSCSKKKTKQISTMNQLIKTTPIPPCSIVAQGNSNNANNIISNNNNNNNTTPNINNNNSTNPVLIPSSIYNINWNLNLGQHSHSNANTSSSQNKTIQNINNISKTTHSKYKSTKHKIWINNNIQPSMRLNLLNIQTNSVSPPSTIPSKLNTNNKLQTTSHNVSKENPVKQKDKITYELNTEINNVQISIEKKNKSKWVSNSNNEEKVNININCNSTGNKRNGSKTISRNDGIINNCSNRTNNTGIGKHWVIPVTKSGNTLNNGAKKNKHEMSVSWVKIKKIINEQVEKKHAWTSRNEKEGMSIELINKIMKNNYCTGKGTKLKETRGSESSQARGKKSWGK